MNSPTPKSSFKYVFFSPQHAIIQHILFWVSYLIVAFYSHFYLDGFGGIHKLSFVLAIDVFTICLNLFILIPRFLFSGKYNKYFLFTLISVFLNLILNFALQNFAIIFDKSISIIECVNKQIYNYYLSGFFLFAAIGLKLFKEYLNSEQKLELLQNAKVNAELDFLKTQMNPHFLFNTLNGIHVLTKTDPERAGETIIKLSDLLRYQIYECSGDQVLLQAEVEYLKRFIELQTVRFPKAKIEIETKGDFGGLVIYPFIFMPFVENAVKHGIDNSNINNYIRIFIEVVNKKLVFIVDNTKVEQKNREKGGIGLINIRKRLELLYPGNYELEIKESEPIYTVKLNINLVQ